MAGGYYITLCGFTGAVGLDRISVLSYSCLQWQESLTYSFAFTTSRILRAFVVIVAEKRY